MKKKNFLIIQSLLIILHMCIYPSYKASAAFQPVFEINSEAAYMVNLDSNTVVYTKNEDKKLYPASLTKIMTAIIVLENVGDLDKIITAPSYIYDELFGTGSSSAGIERNTEVTIKELLYGLMVASGNEAASILANYVGVVLSKGEAAVDTNEYKKKENITYFVNLMNEKAKEIGALNTHFTNPHGLHDSDHYTTARDVYLITSYALDEEKVPRFTEFATATSCEIQGTIRSTTCRMALKNDMYYYENAKPIKTGFTDQAGRCLVTTAVKNGFTYLLITLNGQVYDRDNNVLKERYEYIDAKSLYEWAFSTFDYISVIEKGQQIAEIPLTLSWEQDHIIIETKDTIISLLPKTFDKNAIEQIRTDIPDEVKAPVKAGDVMGKVVFKLGDNVLGETVLVASESADASMILYIGEKITEIVGTWWFKLAVAGVILLIILYIILIIAHNRKKRKRRNMYRAKIMKMQNNRRR